MSNETEFEKGVKGAMVLFALIADPKASAARLAELRQAATDNDKAAAKIEADRAAHEIKVAADKAEVAEDRRRAASVWRTAQEAELKAAGLMERAEAHAAKVGYFERPTHIPIGESGIGMVVFDEAPAPPPRAAPAPETVAESFGAGLSGGRMVARTHRGRA
jgi:hypothetical protein